MPTRPDANPDPKSPRQRLLLFTSLSALDGTIATMAAVGALDDPLGATICGLIVVAGTGAWLSARDGFSGSLGRRDWLRLLEYALVSSGLTLAAAALGGWSATALDLFWLPRAAGLATILLGAEIAGMRIPGLHGVRLPVVVLLTGFALEAITLWIR